VAAAGLKQSMKICRAGEGKRKREGGERSISYVVFSIAMIGRSAGHLCLASEQGLKPRGSNEDGGATGL